MTATPEYSRACALSEIPAEGVIGVEVAGEPVAVVRAEGEVYDHTIECWLHGSCFDLRSGKPTGYPATEPVPVYPVKIEGDDVYVALTISNKES